MPCSSRTSLHLSLALQLPTPYIALRCTLWTLWLGCAVQPAAAQWPNCPSPNLVCQMGQYCSATYQCQYCANGWCSVTNTCSQCTSCQAGKFREFANTQTFCLNCNPGQYSPAGSNRCYDCDLGQVVAAGSSSCTDCKAGTYSNAKISCTPCTEGKYSSSDKATSCTNCPLGQYTLQGTQMATSCLSCSVGKFQGTTGTTFCTNCFRGTYGATTGLSSCLSCTAGWFAAQQGLTTCTKCNPGTYQQYWGESYCTDCTAGVTFASQAGSTSCTACTPPCGNGYTSVVAQCTTTQDRVCQPCPAHTQPHKIVLDTGLALYPAGAPECEWACAVGHVRHPEDGRQCVPCYPPPSGFVFVSTSSETGIASLTPPCTAQCDTSIFRSLVLTEVQLQNGRCDPLLAECAIGETQRCDSTNDARGMGCPSDFTQNTRCTYVDLQMEQL